MTLQGCGYRRWCMPCFKWLQHRPFWSMVLLLVTAGLLYIYSYGTITQPKIKPSGAVPASAPLSAEATSASSGSLTSRYCPDKPTSLRGKQKIDKNTPSPTWSALEARHQGLGVGGTWRPSECESRQRVAIIVPYRDRSEHLRLFLDHMHSFLQRQLIHYGIYVVEQNDYSQFNRGMLFNIGFHEAMKDAGYDCVIFHDVDLLPENDYNTYTCFGNPRHMSVAVDTLKYKLMYDTLFGGAVVMTSDQFKAANGFSNMYFGWGGEDDDLYNRVTQRGLNISRYDAEVSRYTMLGHTKAQPSIRRHDLLGCGELRFKYDGLNSLTSSYELTVKEHRKLYTWIYVWIDNESVMTQTYMRGLQSVLPTNTNKTSVAICSQFYRSYSNRRCTAAERLKHVKGVCNHYNMHNEQVSSGFVDERVNTTICGVSQSEYISVIRGNIKSTPSWMHMYQTFLHDLAEIGVEERKHILEKYRTILIVKHPLVRLKELYMTFIHSLKTYPIVEGKKKKVPTAIQR